MKELRIKSLSDWLTVVLFCGLITLPLLGTFFHWDFYPYEGENRVPATFPDWKTTPLDQLPAGVSAYCDDHFGFRNTFIRRYNGYSDKWFGIKRDGAVLGRDDWLFFDGTIKDYMGFRRYPEAEVRQWADALMERHERLARRNIPYLWAIPPNKIEIYPEKLPEAIPSDEAVTRFEQLLKCLGPAAETFVVYPLEALRSARREKAVFFSNDTHYNDYGAYITYREILKRMRIWRSDLEASPLKAFKITESPHLGDLTIMWGAAKTIDAEFLSLKEGDGISVTDYPIGAPQSWHTWPRNVPPPQVFTNPAGRGRVLVFHDSFGPPFMKFLPAHFEETAFFRIYSNPEALAFLVEDFRPDFIVEIQSERFATGGRWVDGHRLKRGEAEVSD